ncbi:uncharacterized protein [Physcomitrium patens]|uniref:uncharacterized protein isoform X2 n=1 Tax=Physcomitrium patens TaxID=3218 RepID=UPI003CCE07F5
MVRGVPQARESSMSMLRDPSMAVLGLQQRLSSTYLTSNGEDPNQDQDSNLLDIIEAAESAIRTQVAENEELKFALEEANRELQRTNQQMKVGPENTYSSAQASHGRNPNRVSDYKDGHAEAVSLFNHQNALTTPFTGVASSHLRQSNDGEYHAASVDPLFGARTNGVPDTEFGQFPPYSTSASNSTFAFPRKGVEAEKQNLYHGQDLPDINNNSGYRRPQDLLLRLSKPSEDEESNQTLARRLRDASLKESQLISEKRTLERRVAELRLAYDQQEQGLVDAASKALSYRQDVLEENYRLTFALQVAEQEKTTYVQNLMPLLAEYDLQPLVSDAHSVVSHVKVCDLQPAKIHHVLVQKLRSELETYQSKVKDMQYYLPPRQTLYQPPTLYNLPPQSPSYRTHGMEIVPQHYAERPTSPLQQIRVGRPSSESGVSSPRFPGKREDNLHNEAINYQEEQAGGRGFVNYDLVNSRGGEVSDDFEGDEEISFDGSQTPTQSRRGFCNFEAVRSPPQLPPLPEETTSQGFEENDPPPGIEGLRILGDPVLGGRLTACGHPVNGTHLCIFQWVRHYHDGQAIDIEGAAQSDYVITADDCDNIVAVECVPVDERNRKGELVKVMVNDGIPICRDPMMQDQIDQYMTSARTDALFEVNVLEGTSEDVSEPGTLVLRRATYELRRNNGRKQLINEKYSPSVSIIIPGGDVRQCVITCHDRREIYLELRDSRTRDLAVLTFRAFLKAAVDEQDKKKKKRSTWLRG